MAIGAEETGRAEYFGTAFIVGLGGVCAIPIIIFAEYNFLSGMRNAVEKHWNDVDVEMKRRSALIPELSDVVQGFLEHEHGTLDAVMSARRQAENSTSREQRVSAEKEFSGAIGRLLAVVESYPRITSHESVATLQQRLVEAEDKIARCRLEYNKVVNVYNVAVERIPTTGIAKYFSFDKAPYA